MTTVLCIRVIPYMPSEVTRRVIFPKRDWLHHESITLDGYASYHNVIAAAASTALAG